MADTNNDKTHGPLKILAVDTGGTFTDVLLCSGGTLEALKVPSTPTDPSVAVLRGIREILGEGDAFELLHGSTVATNALLERKGARVALVTNAGFEDVIEIGRQNRPQLYALVGHRPPPLVDRENRIGVTGRISAEGEEVEPLDESALGDLAERVSGAESVAVVLLHSYANAAHEERVAEALSGLGTPVSVSSWLLPEFREYERTSTTVVNAYVGPKMSNYLGRLDANSGAQTLRIMGSNGGALSVARAIAEPVHTILSGPAGGVVGALAWAARAGSDRIITFDMGGTSTDVSLCPGEPLQTKEYQIDGQPVAIPVIDIHTVGAGGGSLARVDAGGALRVGPQSAGAEPGPICYGHGGSQVTVTDAHVWLGRIPTDGFLGGAGHLDRDAIAGPMTDLAQALGTTPEAAAQGVLDVADSAMERALRVISVERGFDPSEFVLVAFGGAGGLHVAGLADRLGARSAMIPPDPGLLSAYGMLAAEVTREASRTVLVGADDAERTSRLEDAFQKLETIASASLTDEGVPPETLTLRRWVDARYRGQSFELRVPAEGWAEAFHELHRTRYGYDRRDTSVEAVTVRVVASAPGPTLEHETVPLAENAPELDTISVHADGRQVDATRVWRSDLRAGHEICGPALILEYSSTTWVPDQWRATCDPSGVLQLKRLAAAERIARDAGSPPQ
jgi:N-methylhydantoinase A